MHMCGLLLWLCLSVCVRKCDLLALDELAPHHWHLACGAENTLQAMLLIPAIRQSANHVH